MSLIKKVSIKNKIGIDIGDGLSIPLIENNIPSINKIQFIIREINTPYHFNVLSGNNILSKDNILIDSIDITSPEKIIYIEFNINNLLYSYNKLLITISTKTMILNQRLVNIVEDDIICINKTVDIDNYKLKFELIDCIQLIKIKIEKKEIILDNDTCNILYDKFNKLDSIIDGMSNQKLLDIKTNLKNKFFLN
jgi:hypothetical protein